MIKVKDSTGKYKLLTRSRALVIDNRDPEKRGRIKVRHPGIGDTGWIEYLKLSGVFDVPKVNDLVYLEWDCGEDSYPIAWGNLTRQYETGPDFPEEFRQVIPTSKGMYTPGGHLFEMHDGVAEPTDNPAVNSTTGVKNGIRLTSKNKNKIHIREDFTNQQEYILLEGSNGDLLKIDVQNNKIQIFTGGIVEVKATDQFTLQAGAISATAQGNAVIVSNAVATFSGSGTTNVGDAGSPTNVDGAVVTLAGGAVPLALATAQFAFYVAGVPVISTLLTGQTTKVTGI